MHSDKLRRFIPIVQAVAGMSKDRSTQVGAIAIGPNWEVRALGYNGFPRGCNDELEERHARPAKYLWSEHAERNLIYNAARVGVPLAGSWLLVTHPPCADCARAVVQAGFAGVASLRPSDDFMARWAEHAQFSLDLFKEVGLEMRWLE